MSDEIKLITKNDTPRLDAPRSNAAPGNFIPLTLLTRAGTKSAVEAKSQLDLNAVREKLALGKGQGYWRSLEELAGREDFHQLMEREFPQGAPRDMNPLTRREFVRLMGASLALAGLAGCAFQPAEKILPYVETPENIIPGKPLFYATVMTLGGYAYGLLAESHLGRPIKLEGNPQHPASLGATDVWAQASLLDLYDPDRSQTILNRGQTATWDAFTGALNAAIQKQQGARGAGVRILTETVTSPTLAWQIAQLKALLPDATWHQWEPVTRDNVREGAVLAFGEAVDTTYDFSKADRVVSLDSNFLQEEPGRLVYAREFINKRRAQVVTDAKDKKSADKSRFYAVESMPTITGAVADNRLPLRASDVEAFARALAGAVGVPGVTGEAPKAGVPNEDSIKWVEEIAKDLNAFKGRSIVITGEHQPPVVHALVHAINGALGNAGQTVTYAAPVEASPVNKTQSLKNLTAALNANRVDVLLILGGNPVYNAPVDLKFSEALEKASRSKNRFTAHLGTYFDETGRLCQWHIPEAHYLEAWGDARSFDGTTSIQQPLIVPLYGDVRSPVEIMATLLAPMRSAAIQTAPSGYEIVRSYWMTKRGGPGEAFDKWWNRAIHDGMIAGTAQRPKTVTLRNSFPAPTPAISGVEVTLRTDPSLWDGRFANNAWLQELPRPLTKLVWDNVAHMSPPMADRNGFKQGDLVAIKTPAGTVTMPVLLVPGHVDESITLHLGYGRDKRITRLLAGEDGEGVGFNTYTIRSSSAMSITSGEISAAGGWYQVVTTQEHHLIDPSIKQAPGTVDTFAHRKGDILLSANIKQYRDGHFPEAEHHRKASLYPPMWPSDIATQNQWDGIPGSNYGEPDATGHKAGEHDAENGHGAAAGHGAEGGHGGHDDPGGTGGTKLKEGPFGPDGIDRSHSQKKNLVSPQHFDKPENYAQHQWGMSIDLNSCIGCNTCTIACQAENNIATVGKAMVGMSREMHWLRIDTYYQGSLENPTPYFQPMMCQHCEKAPCEPVCPVEATSHSAEGINEMTYNRCIGTKYCSNNCPYKVRRFNFLQWADQKTPTIQMMRNPDVTVRSRGVMEKCTFCVQRVNSARIQAEREDRAVREGEVLTACQQVCPTNAIIFGNLIDKNSKARALRQNPLTFSVLHELSTHPRVTYLAQIRNPNMALLPATATGEQEHQNTKEHDDGSTG